MILGSDKGVLEMKKGILIFAVLLMVLGLTGCKNIEARKVAETYLKAVQEFDTDQMDACFIPELRQENRTASSGRLEAERLFMDFFIESASQMTYKINRAEIQGDKVIVNVTCTYVDGSDLYSYSIFKCSEETTLRKNNGESFTPEELELHFTEVIENERKEQNPTTIKRTFDIECAEYDGEWYINQATADLGNVATANFFSIGEELADMLDAINQNGAE